MKKKHEPNLTKIISKRVFKMFEKLNNRITSPSHPIFKYFKKDKGTNQPPWLIS